MRGLLLGLVLISEKLIACDEVNLEQARQLIEQHHSLLQISSELYQSQADQSDWKASVQLAYAALADDSGGAQAGLHVEIPLFDRSRQIQQLQSQQAMQKLKDEVQSDFLQATQTLCADQQQLTNLQQQLQLQQDRLAYQQQQVEEGFEQAQTLWAFAENLQNTQQKLQQKQQQVALAAYQIARKFGGEQWQSLQTLLAVSTN